MKLDPLPHSRSTRARTRIALTKLVLDGHDRGANVVARGLRDAGHEVIYPGLHQKPVQIAATDVAEDADVESVIDLRSERVFTPGASIEDTPAAVQEVIERTNMAVSA